MTESFTLSNCSYHTTICRSYRQSNVITKLQHRAKVILSNYKYFIQGKNFSNPYSYM